MPALPMDSGFAGWLKDSKGHGQVTIGIHGRYLGLFMEWAQDRDIDIYSARYADMLGFIDYLRAQGRTGRNINQVLCSVRYYYNYLSTFSGSGNPATGLYSRGVRKKAVAGPIPYETLVALYNGCPENTPGQQRNKLILGLLVYQGVTTEELHKLQPRHIDFEKGTIYVPPGRRSNGRTLQLGPCQIMPLFRYIDQTRPQMVLDVTEGKTLSRPARKPQKIDLGQLDRQLFFGLNGSCNLKNSLLHLSRGLPGIKNAGQIRQSVIAHWLKAYDVRQVQYMAGHRWASSTERYKEDGLKGLQEALEKCHPLRGT
jgi:integrase/recombinase XerD